MKKTTIPGTTVDKQGALKSYILAGVEATSLYGGGGGGAPIAEICWSRVPNMGPRYSSLQAQFQPTDYNPDGRQPMLSSCK
jgi:hypothetical protein